jgi:hypothetical protein
MKIRWRKDLEWISGRGVTVCGREGILQMPGVLSRMYLPWCLHCCKTLEIPTGNGAPFNEGIDK